MGGGRDREDEWRPNARTGRRRRPPPPGQSARPDRRRSPRPAVDFSARCAGCHGAEGRAPRRVWPSRPGPSRRPRPSTSPGRRCARAATAAIHRHRRRRQQPRHAGLRRPGGAARWQLASFGAKPGRRPPPVRATDGGAGYPWDLPPGFPQPKVPADNPMSPAKVELGRYLFYDTRLSADGTFACGTCHEQRLAFTDGKPRAVGSQRPDSSAQRDGARQRRLPPGADLGRPDRAAARGAGAGADVRHRPRGVGTQRHRARDAGPAGRRAALPGDVRGRFPRRADADQRRQRHQGHRLVRADVAVGPIGRTTWPAPAPTRALSRRQPPAARTCSSPSGPSASSVTAASTSPRAWTTWAAGSPASSSTTPASTTSTPPAPIRRPTPAFTPSPAGATTWAASGRRRCATSR